MSTRKGVSLTIGVVVPCFNEEARWDTNYWRELIAASPARFLFVDDGSTDFTRNKIDLVTMGTNSKGMYLPVNAGKAEAVRTGLISLLDDESLDGVGYLDADGAFAIADILRIQSKFAELRREQSIDAVWSSRVALAGRDIQRSNVRHYIGRIVATFVSLGYGAIPYDTQSGFKIFHASDALRVTLNQSFGTRWLFEIELLARWQSANGRPMKIWEEPLGYWHDVPGSKIRGLEALRIARELGIVKREQRRVNQM